MLAVEDAGVRDWAVLATACTPVILAAIGVVQYLLKMKIDKVSRENQQILGQTERTENMAERNTRTLHGEGTPTGDQE